MNGHNHSFRPGVTRPFSVLVTELGTGAFLVQDYQTGATVCVSLADGGALREALETAFGAVGTEIRVPPIVRPRMWHR